MKISSILIGKTEIAEFLKVSDNKLNYLIQAGLPVKKIAGGWVGHTEVIEEFFKKQLRINKKSRWGLKHKGDNVCHSTHRL
jgi:hypothetical protein